MTRKKDRAKVLKMAMVGAVALTPVLAVDVEASAAAPTNLTEGEKKAIKDFITEFNKLDTTKKHLIRIVMQELGKDPSKSLEESYANPNSPNYIGLEYKNLLTFKLLSDVTEPNLQSKYSEFKEAVASKKEDVTSEELVTYFTSVVNALTKAVNDLTTSQYSDLLGSGLYNDLFQVYLGSNVPDSLKPVIKVPDTSIINGIQTAFNTYLNPPSSGGGPITPPPVDEEPGEEPGDGEPGGEEPGDKETSVETDTDAIESNPEAVIDAITKAPSLDKLTITTPENATNISIPLPVLTAVENKNANAVIAVNFGDTSYELPVTSIDVGAVAKELGVEAAELKLNITAEKVDNPLDGNANYKTLSDAVNFEVALVAPNGKSVQISVFPMPVKRTVTATNPVNPQTTVGVTVDANGNVTAVPTYVGADNKTADLYRSGNSVYTLIENSKTFIDVDNGVSFAEEYIEKLASRMVVNGKTETNFQPTATITRGEFAAILSRGLGIVPADKDAKKFKDVSTSQAVNKNGEIAAVVEAGIVAGYEDGTFRPNQKITRDQAAIMISRAIDYVGKEKVTFDAEKKSTAFKDYKSIGPASRDHVERVYQAGFLDGYTDNTFRPSADADRAQMSKILYNFLASVKYIN
ncbi:S-layer homology domain-containing protein [Sporosarcina sp. HYO08]|uniref:S-layer homology domain-containing protein n=1 Tax=Sporosarcina sp. HYO08 TaxID=1759557 RepID=UPI00079AA8C3|nr:S-layer homology domain-containing protein [Sporosarcina sp. HYO08]KXH86881.1 hypothetical protein AU377_13685 [Sporosarcina sp. HYO08]